MGVFLGITGHPRYVTWWSMSVGCSRFGGVNLDIRDVERGIESNRDVLAVSRANRPRAVWVMNPPERRESVWILAFVFLYRLVLFIAALVWLFVVFGAWYLMFGGGLVIK